jgi:hypothetical protein
MNRTGSLLVIQDIISAVEYAREKTRVDSDRIYLTVPFTDGAKKKKPLFRRVSNHVRLTLFESGHEIIHEAAMVWLAGRKRP